MKKGSLELDLCRVSWNEEEEAEKAGDRRITSVRALSLSCSVYRGNHIRAGSVDRTCFSFIILSYLADFHRLKTELRQVHNILS